MTTSTGYDGLGRAVMTQVNTVHSSDTITSSYLGGTLTGTTSVLHGDTSMLWGAVGRLEGIVHSGDDEVRWALLDRLGSVVAEATGADGASISELVSYSEYGEPVFESVGYQNPYGYTGEPQDAGTGRVSFGSRDYDPTTAVWFTPDQWPGLLVAPQSLNRYGYVLGDPVTYADLGGYRLYEPGCNVYMRGGRWVAEKQAPSSPQKPSLMGVRSVGMTGSASTGYRVSKDPYGYSAMFESARHATATRKTTGESCSGSSTNRYVIQGCAGKHIAPVDWNVVRKTANLPVSFTAKSLALAAGGTCQEAENGLIVCYAPALNVQGGTTYGEVFITVKEIPDVLADPNLLGHEQAHSVQWAALGPLLFSALYLLEAGESSMTSGNYGCTNMFEVMAGLEEGNYSQICKK